MTARRLGRYLIWLGITAAMVLPLLAASQSPLLAWREPIYIIAGISGIVALSLMVVQPILAAGLGPGLSSTRSRRVHQAIGGLIVAAVLIHVGGLWITSPPDVIDTLLFASPAPFGNWGVVAMWALFLAALLSLVRRRIRVRLWRLGHTSLIVLVVVCTVIHAALIEGTMEPISKALVSICIVAATLAAVHRKRVWLILHRR